MAQAELYLDLPGHDINNMHQIALGYLELAREKHPEPRLIKNVRKLQKLREDVLGSAIVDPTRVLADVQGEP
jgi:hypothetical protein